MRTADRIEIVAIAAVCALAVGLLGLLAAWLLRRRSVRWQVGLVVLVAVAAPYLGISVVAERMLISRHDFTVVTFVGSAAALVSLAVALALGEAVARWSRSLRSDVRRLVSGDAPDGQGVRGPAEFRELAAELKLSRARLDEAQQRERQLEESRRDLVSWVSHDLRTPLAGLRAMTEALEDGMAPDPARYHQQVRAEVDRMAQMVDDLFELSRLDGGVLRINPEPVLLGDLISDALAGADQVARARSVRLGGTVEEHVHLSADPAGISRALANLIANAVRHTPSEGLVRVEGRSSAGQVELSVTDQCGGIADQDLHRVFERGWQGDAARTPAPASADALPGKGAGLGLAIVKGIVEAHRGEVLVENLAPATGCRFVIRLPLTPTP
ncbi:sensor histidine kinase [Nocardioides lianchengensis]|uniref:Sensor-like histidine kinase SenX3 n=1 Tax=Nocardioides lianchengensis TaxID=1045774 RepID=A0A1G6XBQ8_9ACTN|nr:HAMP domain-containing sensor histidine kinase [Nocardioides lianchengensis]NYG09024.1 signal transduction histidine kinase [Nocardioides lianchengensis]SDD75511.1 Histidine kinase-, DNA gyrase B-, and HSP90-like ATPase [Nocardioides lianchengensis]